MYQRGMTYGAYAFTAGLGAISILLALSGRIGEALAGLVLLALPAALAGVKLCARAVKSDDPGELGGRGERQLASELRRLDDRVASVCEQVISAHQKLLEATSVEKAPFAGGGTSTLDYLSGEARERLLDAEVHLGSIAERLDDIQKSQTRLATRTRNAIADGVRDVEGIFQLQRLVPSSRVMPPTGRFAVNARSLVHLAALVNEVRPMRLVELGSGSSTVWLGYIVESYGGHIVSLDHLEHYGERTRASLSEHGLFPTAELRMAPLVPVVVNATEYSWYNFSALDDQVDIDFLVVDGPPGDTGRCARYPALPLLVDRLADSAWVVLDDALRDDERESVDSWVREIPGLTEVFCQAEDLAVLRYERPPSSPERS